MGSNVKAQIVIPEDLLRTLDRLVGGRRRSEFVVAAIRERISRLRFQEALKAAAGSWSEANHPEAHDRTRLNRWIRKSRTGATRRLS
ncbi:MAG: hypothetical protein HYY18_07170 [Planctomycetes bacterium]|nr:hypothetical protein [Planctomycetota bacterium]